MNLDEFHSRELNKNEPSHSSFSHFVSNFMQELSNSLRERKNEHIQTKVLKEDTIYVINGIQNEEIGVVNIENGEEFDIYIATDKSMLQALQEKGIHQNIYEMSKKDFYPLELGNKLQLEDGILFPYTGEIKIKNDIAWEKLEDLFFNLEQEEGRTYVVTDISGNKIYMEDTDNQGHYEVYQELYPDWKMGDTILRKDGKYQKINN